MADDDCFIMASPMAKRNGGGASATRDTPTRKLVQWVVVPDTPAENTAGGASASSSAAVAAAADEAATMPSHPFTAIKLTSFSDQRPASFYELETRRLKEHTRQLNEENESIQAHIKRRQRDTDDEIAFTKAMGSMSMEDGGPVPVAQRPLMAQHEFISADIDRRIRRAAAAPEWLVKALFDEITKEVMDEIIKETVADGKKVCQLPDSEIKKSAELMQSPLKKVIADKFNIELLGVDLVKLRNLDWLSDQSINFYFEMLGERQKRNQASSYVLPSQQYRIHYFNTFFYKKLSPDAVRYVYKDVSRWLKRAKVDVLTLDKIIVPVHVHGNHWCLAIINLRAKQFEYYDSLGGSNPSCLRHLRQFLQDEVTAAHPTKLAGLELDAWQDVHMKNVPRQNNGSDCGVFTIKFADYSSENRPFAFTHRDMPYFRRRIALEILYQRVV